MIELLQTSAAYWWHWTWAGFWQVALLIAVVAMLDRVLSRTQWPQLRLALWTLVLIKLMLPPTWYHPLSIGPAMVAESEVPFVVYGVAHTLDQLVGIGAPLESTIASVSGTLSTEMTHTWMMIAFAVWLVGVTVLGGAFIYRVRSLRQAFEVDAGRHNVPRWIRSTVLEVSRDFGLRRAPRVIVTNVISCPAVFGLVRPVLLIPPVSLETLDRKDLRNILLHEVAHIKRGDLFYQMAFVWVTILNWYNPLLYLMRNRIYELRELSCDATVASVLQERTPQYRETLLRAAERLLRRPLPLRLESVGLFENPAGIVQRLECLEKLNWSNARQRRGAALAFMLAVAVFVLPMGRSEPPPTCDHCTARDVPLAFHIESRTGCGSLLGESDDSQHLPRRCYA